MTTLLAIETATEACSVALLHGDALVARHEIAPRRHAELVLPMIEGVLAEAGVARSGLDAIAVGRGPGAFTGVRLAIAIAQGLALALDRPVVPVSTLAALAVVGLRADPDARTPVLAVIDARMGELYAAAYAVDDDGLPRAIADEALVAPARLSAYLESIRSGGRTRGVAEEPTPGVEGARVRADHAALAGDATLADWRVIGSGIGAHDAAIRAALGGAAIVAQPEALPDALAIAQLAARDFARHGGVDALAAQPVYLRDRVAETMAERAAARAGK